MAEIPMPSEVRRRALAAARGAVKTVAGARLAAARVGYSAGVRGEHRD